MLITRIKKLGVVDRDKSIHHKISRPTAEWAKQGIIYEIYTRCFTSKGTFKSLETHLPRLKELGVDIIWLMPIHPIGITERKGKLGSPYSVRDYFEINPEYGTKQDFKHLVNEIHNIGMRIIIDMVANHSANDYIAIKDHPDWFAKDKIGHFTRKISHWSDVTDLNYQNSELRQYTKNAILYWIKEFNIDGYRCDVAGMVPDDFWDDVRQELNKIRQDIFLLAEWEDPQMHLFSFDATYDWILYYKYIEVSQGKVSPEEIIDLLIERRQEFPIYAPRLRFIENHDKQRAIATFGDRFFRPLAIFIFTIDGIPLIYNGQEIGETDYLSLFEKGQIKWDRTRGKEIYGFYKFLISLRKQNPVLVTGDLMKIGNDQPDKLVTFHRMDQRGTQAFVTINFSGETVRFNKPHFPLNSESLMIQVNSQMKIRYLEKDNYLTIAPFDGIIIFNS